MSAKVSLRLQDGATTELSLGTMTSEMVLSGVPWRAIRSHRGQRHFPGLYWSSTTGGHMVYESRLELARLLLADADGEIVGIAAQPFLVRDKERRHVPDFLLARADGSVLMVNVKPALRLDDPHVAAALAWAGRIFAVRGWQHEIWSGADPYLLATCGFSPATGRALIAHRDAVWVLNAPTGALTRVDPSAPRATPGRRLGIRLVDAASDGRRLLVVDGGTDTLLRVRSLGAEKLARVEGMRSVALGQDVYGLVHMMAKSYSSIQTRAPGSGRRSTPGQLFSRR